MKDNISSRKFYSNIYVYKYEMSISENRLCDNATWRRNTKIRDF